MAIKCETCGMEYEEPPGKFCERCGRVLERINLELEDDSDSEHQKCNQCGHRNPLDARVCANCGELLYQQRIS